MSIHDEQRFYDNLHKMNKVYNNLLGYIATNQIPKYEEFEYIIKNYLDLEFGGDITKLSLSSKNLMCDLIANTYELLVSINEKLISNNRDIILESDLINNGIDKEIEAIIRLYKKDEPQIISIITYLRMLKFSDKLSSESNFLTKLNTNIEENGNQIESLRKLLKETNDLAHQTAVSNYSHLYKAEAKTQGYLSWVWFIGLIIVIISFLLLAWHYINNPIIVSSDNFNAMYTFLSIVLARASTLGVLVFLIYWLGKKYNITRHNYTINKAKEHALATFDVFINAETDPVVRKIILIKTTDYIYSHRSSGYITEEEISLSKSNMESVNNIIEMLQKIGK